MAAGWPVVPGAWWSPIKRRHACDIPGCVAAGPHPSVAGVLGGADIAAYALWDPDAVDARWAEHPYAIMVPTGIACDAIEAPEALASRLVGALSRRNLLGIVAAHRRRWLIFTETGGGSDELSFGGDHVLIHGTGSWVILPPSLVMGTPVEWIWPPPHGRRWWLPARHDVLAVLTVVGDSG